MKVELVTIKGEKLSEKVNLNVQDIKMTPEEFAQIIRVYVTNLHQGTKKAKTRGEVSYPDTKPFRQKGTGRARAGSKNSPIWTGGGVAHGPRPHTRRLSINKKQKVRALNYMLTKYLEAQKVLVLDDSDIKNIATKEAYKFLKEVNLHPYKVQLIVAPGDEILTKAFKNLEKVKIRRAHLISPFDLYRESYLLIAKSALNILNKRLEK